MKRLLILISLIAAFASSTVAFAQDLSPYIVGHWNLADTLPNPPASPIVTDDTDFTFLNPTNLTLTLEYAFFAPDGTFCGCDRDTLNPNGRTRYTMLAEKQGGQFSTTLCPTQTEGELKSIVFVGSKGGKGKTEVMIGDAEQGGTQIHIFGSNRSESNMQGVTLNRTIMHEINAIHAQCVAFIGH